MIRVQVERRKRDDQNLVEYRLTLTSMHCVEQELDEVIPGQYIAGYVMNALRECLAKCELDDEIRTVISDCKKNAVYTCPKCGSKLEGTGRPITWAI